MPRHNRRGRPGGGLSICGCRWRVASDDLVLPSWIEFFSRLVGVAVLGGVLYFAELAKLDSCASEYHLHLYLIVAIVLFALNMANNAALAIDSARGVIWDANSNARALVRPLIYLNIFLTVGEFFWAFVGSAWVVRGLFNSCVKPEPYMTLKDAPLMVILGVLVCTWIGLAFKAVVYLLSFNSIDCEAGNNESFVMEAPKSAVSKLLSSCMVKTQLDFFKDIAHVLSDTFDDDRFVPTDIAAALLILFVQQEQQDEVIVVNKQLLTQAPENEREEQNEEKWISLERMKHFMPYAGASYGYTWFLMKSTRLNFWKLYPYLGCCGCCGCCNSQKEYVEADNCLGCNTAALRAMLPHLDAESIVHISYRNKLLEVPFFVAVDHKYKKIVVSIRGTLSLEDALTDLCAKPESLGAFHESLSAYYAHSGMVKAANYVHKELTEKHLLDKAFSYFEDYQLVVTGHSLGAGTAVVLTFMLRLAYPNTKCYAYSPPGGLVNEAAAKASEDFAVSIVVGHDLVGRLSLQSLSNLKASMSDVLTRCQLPKYQVLAGICSWCISDDWKNHLAEHGPAPSRLTSVEVNNEVTQSPVRRLDSEASDDSKEPILEASRQIRYESFDEIQENNRRTSLSRMKMVLPGTVWHVAPTGADRGADAQWVMSQKTWQDFQDIVVSPKMLTDHFPNNVQEILMNVNTVNKLSQE